MSFRVLIIAFASGALCAVGCAKGADLDPTVPPAGGTAGVENNGGSDAGTAPAQGGDAGAATGQGGAEGLGGAAPGEGGKQGSGGSPPVGNGGAPVVTGACPTTSGRLEMTSEPKDQGTAAVTRISAPAGESVPLTGIDVRFCFETIGEAEFDTSEIDVYGGVENLADAPYYVDLAGTQVEPEGDNPYCLVFDISAAATATLSGSGSVRLEWTIRGAAIQGGAMINPKKPATFQVSLADGIAACIEIEQ